VVVAEFEDYALLRTFGQRGTGLLPVPSVLEKDFHRHYALERIGPVDAVLGRFYAVSVERKIRNAAVAAICDAARRTLFAGS
jgi:LysR family transcriptional activator of nhaA